MINYLATFRDKVPGRSAYSKIGEKLKHAPDEASYENRQLVGCKPTQTAAF